MLFHCRVDDRDTRDAVPHQHEHGEGGGVHPLRPGRHARHCRCLPRQSARRLDGSIIFLVGRISLQFFEI